MSKKDLAIIIGRFQIWTKGHQALAKHATRYANNLCVICGSHSEERTEKNPLLFEERRRMIGPNLQKLSIPYEIRSVPDFDSDKDWVAGVNDQIDVAALDLYLNENYSKVLVGMYKDSSSYYLDLFPGISYVELPRPEDMISATDAREIMYGRKEGNLGEIVTPETGSFLNLYAPIFKEIVS